MQSQITKARIFLLIGQVFILLQIIFDTANVLHLSPHVHAYIGFGAMLSSLLSSGFKQYFDPKINNGTLFIQIACFVAFVAGGILDQFNLLPFTEEAKIIIRVALTVVINYVPILIKTVTQEK